MQFAISLIAATRILAGCLALSLSSECWAGQSCDDSVVINLTMDYSAVQFNAGKLPGVLKDREILHQIYGDGPNVHYIDVNPKTANKQEILAKIKKMVEGHDHVIFNYSGHGLKSYTNPAYSPNDVKQAVVDLGNRNAGTEAQFQIPTPKFYDCSSKATSGCQQGCVVKVKSPGMSVSELSSLYSSCEQACDNVNINPDLGKCYQANAISADDLSAAFKGKRMTGMIDACYSGALKLKDVPYSFVGSVDEWSKAPDSAEGGVLSRAAKQLCGRMSNGKGYVQPFQLTGEAKDLARTFTSGPRAIPHIYSDVKSKLSALGNDECLIPTDGKACGYGSETVQSLDDYVRARGVR